MRTMFGNNAPGRFFQPVFFFVLLVSIAVPAVCEPSFQAPGIAEPGSVLQVLVDGEELANIVVSLTDLQGRAVSRAEGFRLIQARRSPVSVALLGIPSSASPGDYRLVLTADQGRAERRMERPLRLAERDFPEQIISMNGKMDSLYSDNSEQKKAESRVLWDVLTRFEPQAQYHFGPFTAPLAAGVPTASFGDRRRFRMLDGTERSSIHYGSDFWAEKGTDIRACGRGRVVMARERLLTGNTVIVEHLPGVYTLYYHMQSIDVMEGQMVEQGEVVGSVGDTGFATGEHLHWEMRVGTVPVDPLQFLSRALLDVAESR